jgi:hypothetical protein
MQLFDAQGVIHRLFILLPVLFISLIALSLSFIKREVTRKQLIMIYAISIATINILEVLGLYLCSQAAYLPHVLIISNIGILLFLAAFTLLTRKTKVFWVKLLLCLIVFGMLGASVLGASWIARNALESGVFGITVEKPDINDIDPDRLLQIKQAYLDMKTETMGHHDMTTDDVLVVKYCGTYNECVVMMFTDSQSFYTTAIRTASVAGVQFTYSDSNQLYAWKSGEMYTLEQAYEAKILRRSDIRDIRNIHAQIPADFSGIGTEIPKIDDAVTGFNLNKIGLANVGGCRVGAIESEEELYAALNDLIAKWKYLMITIGSENHIEPDELENMNYRDIYHDKYPTRTVVLVMRNNLNMEALKDLSLREDVSFIWISEQLVAVPDED